MLFEGKVRRVYFFVGRVVIDRGERGGQDIRFVGILYILGLKVGPRWRLLFI